MWYYHYRYRSYTPLKRCGGGATDLNPLSIGVLSLYQPFYVLLLVVGYLIGWILYIWSKTTGLNDEYAH